MAGKKQSATKNGSTHIAKAPKRKSRTVTIGDAGIYNSRQFANYMSALMSDVVSQALAPDIVNAACNAGGKLLKVVEMQYKYGKGGALSLAKQP